MAEPLSCWRCGAPIAPDDLPLTRRSACRQCGVDLHVCRMCRYYNPRLSRKCDEDQAEPPREAEVANFCDWFEPVPRAAEGGKVLSGEAAAAKFAALFGDDTEGEASGDGEADPAARMAALLREAEKNKDD